MPSELIFAHPSARAAQQCPSPEGEHKVLHPCCSRRSPKQRGGCRMPLQRELGVLTPACSQLQHPWGCALRVPLGVCFKGPPWGCALRVPHSMGGTGRLLQHLQSVPGGDAQACSIPLHCTLAWQPPCCREGACSVSMSFSSNLLPHSLFSSATDILTHPRDADSAGLIFPH